MRDSNMHQFRGLKALPCIRPRLVADDEAPTPTVTPTPTTTEMYFTTQGGELSEEIARDYHSGGSSGGEEGITTHDAHVSLEDGTEM